MDVLRALSCALVAASMTGAAQAGPCTAVSMALDDRQKAELAETVASQVEAPTVDILDAFRRAGWQMLYVDTHQADEAVLFFPGDPQRHRYVARWSGAARLRDGPALRRWAARNVPGLPPQLATCFASYVTHGRTQ